MIQKNVNFIIEEESDEETPTRQSSSTAEVITPGINGMSRLYRKYPKGAVYEGQYDSSGRKDGEGRIVFPNGCVYEGMWKKDKASGMGILKLLNGETYEGEF